VRAHEWRIWRIGNQFDGFVAIAQLSFHATVRHIKPAAGRPLGLGFSIRTISTLHHTRHSTMTLSHELL
jgi:hypothetical protein